MLSIQSHVVRGYVGNKSASFPLQVSAVHPRLATAGAARYTRDNRARAGAGGREGHMVSIPLHAVLVQYEIFM